MPEAPPVVDLTQIGRGRDVAVHIKDRKVPSLTIRMPYPHNPGMVEIVRDGLDLYAVPTLLRLWANRCEAELTGVGGIPEEVLGEEDAPVRGGE